MRNEDDIFNKYMQDIIPKENVEKQIIESEKPKQKQNENQLQNINTENNQLENKKEKTTLSEKFLNKVIEYASTSGEVLDQKTKMLAVDIITSTNKSILGQQIEWNMVDINGCNLVSQIKRWAKLGVSMEDKLYPDIRKNSKTGLYDITIKGQYQTIEKLIRMYYMFQVVRFKEDVICIGDELYEDEDFTTGLSIITGHKRNNEIDRNSLENIIGAYKILYFFDSDKKLKQYVVKIDKNRIDRAYKASPSREKTVWNLDSKKMVLKTATWEMWNDKNIRAFMIFPEDVINDLSIIEETNEMDWNAETKYNNVNQAQENVQKKVASKDVINMKYEDA